MEDQIKYLHSLIGKAPAGSKTTAEIDVDRIMQVCHTLQMLHDEAYVYPPDSLYMPDGLSWKRMYAFKEQEKQGGAPLDTYLKTLKATSEMLLEHHRQAVDAMKQVMQDKDAKYIEDVWREAMKAFMTLPKDLGRK